MTEYFLMTNNYLIPHKQYYCTKKVLTKDLLEIIRDSERAYKKELKMEAEEEFENNKKLPNVEDHRFSKQTLCKEFKKFDKVHLEMSIKTLKFESENPVFHKIFLEKQRRKY